MMMTMNVMRMNMRFRWLKMLGLLIIMSSTSCTQTPPSKYYILTSLKSGQVKETSAKVVMFGIGPIKLPGRLDRAQILTRKGKNAVNIHEYHRWGDSLQRQVEEVLAKNLSEHLKVTQVVVYPWEHALRPKYQILITVRHLEGNPTSGTQLDVIWQLIDVDQDKLILSKHFVTSVPTSTSTMTSYIDSQSQALIKLSETIAQSVSALEDQSQRRRIKASRDE